MNKFIYADNAATTKLSSNALSAMLPWLEDKYGNPSQPYLFSHEVKRALSNSREIIAACIGASPNEIYFTSGGTESNNWVLKCSALLNSNHNITITSSFEHHSILNSCSFLERFGYPVYYINPDTQGYVQLDILNEIMSYHPCLVSIMTVNNELGTIQNIKELSNCAHFYGSLFHSDAVTAVGHLKINVKELGVDFLSASAHKFNGPKGIGFLYIKDGINLPAYIDGGSQEQYKRAGTENIASIVGMAVALKENCDRLDSNSKYLLDLEHHFLSTLKKCNVPYKRNGGKCTLPGLLNLSFQNEDGERLLHCLDLMGIYVSTGSACDSSRTDISHVLKAIKLENSFAKGTIRISFGVHNTIDDLDEIVKALCKLLKLDMG